MQTILIVASLWATTDPRPRAQLPIVTWLMAQMDLAANRIHQARAKIDFWAEKTFDIAFDIRVLSLADDAAREIRLIARTDEPRKGSVVIPRRDTKAVQSMMSHILAAGDARIAAEHTVVTRAGTPARAEKVVDVEVTYVDPMGVPRVGLTKRPGGDAFRVHPTDVTLSKTRFSITAYSDRSPEGTATSEFNARGDLRLGESLLIFREAASPVAVHARSVVTAGRAVLREPPPSQAVLIIVTPRRVMRGSASKPSNP
ncbi:MAG TPA: hypothetical protein VM510_05705 [Caulifigura sp.]|nr:hypothetical protein [Caulifigura sp.]